MCSAGANKMSQTRRTLTHPSSIHRSTSNTCDLPGHGKLSQYILGSFKPRANRKTTTTTTTKPGRNKQPQESPRTTWILTVPDTRQTKTRHLSRRVPQMVCLIQIEYPLVCCLQRNARDRKERCQPAPHVKNATHRGVGAQDLFHVLEQLHSPWLV